MLAVNYTNLRENMKTYMDKVTDDYETMIVTRKDNRNVVMISEESYNNLMENVYVINAFNHNSPCDTCPNNPAVNKFATGVCHCTLNLPHSF